MLLPVLAGSRTFCEQHHSRVNRFIESLKNSENVSVQYVINRAHTNTVGPLGKNILYLKTHSKADRDRSVPLESSRIDQIRELIRARDGLDQLSVLNREEIQVILDYVCTY